MEISALSVLESEESYVNILLGNYEEPEVHRNKSWKLKNMTNTNLQDFLRKFSRYNFAGHCLGLLFTNRLFKDLVLGMIMEHFIALNNLGSFIILIETIRDYIRMMTTSFNVSLHNFVFYNTCKEKLQCYSCQAWPGEVTLHLEAWAELVRRERGKIN